MDQAAEPDSKLGEALAEAMKRVMRVAGEKDDERSTLRQERLAEMSGVSLSAIKRSLSRDAGSTKIATVEKLAVALGVPPAFLLMRKQDWVAMVSATHTILQNVLSEAAGQARAARPNMSNPSPVAAANAGAHIGSQSIGRLLPFCCGL